MGWLVLLLRAAAAAAAAAAAEEAGRPAARMAIRRLSSSERTGGGASILPSSMRNTPNAATSGGGGWAAGATGGAIRCSKTALHKPGPPSSTNWGLCAWRKAPIRRSPRRAHASLPGLPTRNVAGATVVPALSSGVEPKVAKSVNAVMSPGVFSGSDCSSATVSRAMLKSARAEPICSSSKTGSSAASTLVWRSSSGVGSCSMRPRTIEATEVGSPHAKAPACRDAR